MIIAGKKTVLLPLKVPTGLYCWHHLSNSICQHFNNEGGNPSCDLRIGYIEYDDHGARKPDECIELKEAEDGITK